MLRQRSRWIAAALVAALALAGPVAPAWAAQGGSAGFGRVWAWLASLLVGQPAAAASSDQCLSIDPNGRCLDGAAAGAEKCLSIDPDGRCLDGAAANAEKCLSIDPNGRCLTGAAAGADKCSSIDPDG